VSERTCPIVSFVMVARLAPPHSQLRAFVFQQLAYNIRNSGWEMYERGMPMFRKECLGNGELLQEFLRMLVLTANEEEEEERARATANVGCLWHTHLETPACRPESEIWEA
jgi:hypothetical protein